ncbi:MAG: hypothetical protein ACM3ZV_04445 [Bacillota bacterium]
MTRTPLLITLAAAAALAGCNKQDHTIVAGGPPADADANAAVNAPVALPPAIISTKLYRCADNSVVTVDYLSDNKSANVHVGKDSAAAPVQVTAAEPGKPMTAEGGYSVEGSPTSSSARIAVPGHSSQTCNA